MNVARARIAARLIAARIGALAVVRALASTRRSWRSVHQAADRYEPRLRRLLQRAFAKARRALDEPELRRALAIKDEFGALLLVSKAIEALQAALKDGRLERVLAAVLNDSASAAERSLRTLRAAAPKIEGFAFDKTNPKAVEWVREHALELVNDLTGSTRDRVRELIEEAFTDQVDIDTLTDQIEAAIGDADRAETIARTETMEASNRGQQELWDQAVEAGLLTGTEKKEWIVTPDDRLCDICEPMDGVTTELDGTFEVDGEEIESPPAHPRCRCTIGLSA